MRPTPKPRLDTQAAARPLAAPNPAFAALDLGSLPAGPEPAPPATASLPPARMGRVVLRRETAHRGGKTVVVVEGFGATHSQEAIAALARQVRQACGCGGTVRERAFEIQGHRVPQIRALLEAEGFQVAGER